VVGVEGRGSSSPTGLSAATTIGDYVTVGAGSILRSTTISNGAVVGKKCILMEGSVVRRRPFAPACHGASNNPCNALAGTRAAA
jgi:carbonic anhydrase/acetyltransferase-like protein (isoleucine patch superfamily)